MNVRQLTAFLNQVRKEFGLPVSRINEIRVIFYDNNVVCTMGDKRIEATAKYIQTTY
ncbi:MAG: hypothetical protein ACK5LG_21775 [Bacteroides thetaiotaomicron]